MSTTEEKPEEKPEETPSQNQVSYEHVIYASVAVVPLTVPQLAELLNIARAANEVHGLTGMLLHVENDGSFFQVLEGDAASIDQLLQNLRRDQRHSNLTIIIREPIPQRSFDTWTMGFASLSADELRNIPGFNDFFQDGFCIADLGPGRAKKLLAAFADGSWRRRHVAPRRKAA
jgi:hypothetical protein